MTRRELVSSPISWMARNPVAANLAMVLLIGGGLAMAFKIRQEVFPAFDLDRITVSVPYPGASPAEVEQGIVLAIEENVRSIEGVKEVRSTAREGYGWVEVELEIDTNKNKALSDVKNAVDRVVSFPLEAERPIVKLVEIKRRTMSIALFGNHDEKILREMAEQIRDELIGLDNISIVELSGSKPLEVAVEIPRDTLRSYSLTLSDVASTIRRTALEMPAGGVKTAGGEVLLRTAERRITGRDFADIPVVVGEDGNPVTLGSIANIEDGFMETDSKATFEGERAIFLNIFAMGDQSPTEVAREAKGYMKHLEQTLPPGLRVAVWRDRSEIFTQRIDLLLRNGLIGFVLVLVILGLFLEPRIAFWVTMGIPASFLGSFLIIPTLGVSLNMISLFAFIVTLGMVVDDAIIVGENAYRLMRSGMSPLKAAIEGAREVSVPVFFSIATTIAAFSPLLFMPGFRGKFLVAIPIVSISVLVISLIESFFILPSHISHIHPSKAWERVFGFQRRFSLGVERFIQKVYGPLLSSTLRQRWVTLAIGISIFVVSFGVLKGGHIKFIDFPREESDSVWVEAKLPFGVPIEETEALAQRMIEAARKVAAAHGGTRISRGIFSHIGGEGSHSLNVGVLLVPTTERDISSHKFSELWRTEIGDIVGLESIKFDSATGHGSTPPIDFLLSHRDPVTLENAARHLAAELATFDGVTDINDGVENGKPQLDFKLSSVGVAAGLTVRELAAQVRNSFYGSEALRQQRGRNEIRVLVRLPRAERKSLADVDKLIIQTPAGGEIPLSEAASIDFGRSYTKIERTDGHRTLRVKAEVIESKANAQEITEHVLGTIAPKLKQRFPGISLSRAGRQKSQAEFWDYLKTAYLFALLAIFGLIAIPLKSYLQPVFVVMMAIPFGFVGAVVGHLALGLDWSRISWMGFVALSGVVVNDSLVLVNAANRFRRAGQDAIEAASNAAKQRFRPIILTSLTTFGGLTPMIFETSVQARILIPMAVALGFGVLFSTAIILLIVPSLFVIIEHFRDFFKDPETHEQTP